MAGLSFAEMHQFKELGTNKWETIHPPQKMGNTANIAYGGFQLAVAAQAACKSVPSNYHIYTMMGNFLGPALTDRPLIASTKPIRRTRTFATLQIEVSQRQNDGEKRPCLVALADFQVQEKGNVLVYSAPPRRKYSHHSSIPSRKEATQKLVDAGKVSQSLADAYNASFGMMDHLYDIRSCPEGIFSQNLSGLSKRTLTTQSSLPIDQKSTAEWVRQRTALPSQTEHVTSLAFLMDGALSFAPLSFSNMFLDDSAACSSLDFALRLFSNEVDMGRWCLREIVTVAGAEGRTFSEGRLWDEEGRMVATMTQQSIMRAWPEGKRPKL